jgi:hypothetical protein
MDELNGLVKPAPYDEHEEIEAEDHEDFYHDVLANADPLIVERM